MTEISIRKVQGAEIFDAAHFLYGYSFEGSPPLASVTGHSRQQALEEHVDTRCFMLFKAEQLIACAYNSPLTQNVRGKIYSASGVWDVATHPNERRKGYSRQVLERLLADARDEGAAFSALYPYKESFYERLGYTTFPQPCIAEFPTSALAPLLKMDLPGAVELVPIEQGYRAYRTYLRQQQQNIHGMALFDGSRAIELRGQEVWLAIARVDGVPVGMMSYRIQGFGGTMTVYRLFYDDSRARYLLLEWLARHVDQVKSIKISLPPFEQPGTWLADLNVSLSASKTPLGRVADVAAIGGMQSGPGRFTARISDPLCSWNEGRYAFETIEGVLHVGPTDEADCDLGIQALSALVFGTHDPGDLLYRGWGNPAPETQATMRAMFPRRLPYLHEGF